MIIHTVTLPLHHVQMPDRSCIWADVLFVEETEELPENSKQKQIHTFSIKRNSYTPELHLYLLKKNSGCWKK